MFLQAKLKLDRRISEANLKARVLAIIDELGLSRCANTRIGVDRENGKVLQIYCQCDINT